MSFIFGAAVGAFITMMAIALIAGGSGDDS